ncbi:MAG: ABC transporter permease [Chloroflexota bacterium]
MKKWLDPLGTVWVGITTHKLRSFLTMLGVVIGVASVITLMSIGKGAQAQILSRIQTLGSDRITIRPGTTVSYGGVRGPMVSFTSFGSSSSGLTFEDAQVIAEQVANISTVASTKRGNLQAVVGKNNTNSSVIGTAVSYPEISNLELSSGTFFSESDYQRGAKVAVLGSNVKDTLFADAEAVGQQVRLGNNIVTVVGVLGSKGSGFDSPDDSIYIPLTAMQQMVAQSLTNRGEHAVSTIELTVSDESMSDTVVEEITALLRSRHRLSASANDDFSISSMQAISEAMQEATGTMTLLLGAIAAISLLVGGIGVMNIMLVSVLERTREIGIRKALGARERDIWVQFLLEAAALTFTGGVIGVVIGWIIAFVVAQMGLITTVVSADIVVLAVVVSVGIGLFFGFYPAWNASRLDPIQALRSE